MSRRVSLPGAAELFRPTPAAPVEPRPVDPDSVEPDPVGRYPADPAAPRPSGPTTTGDPGTPADGRPRSSGRVRHEEKITVYVSAEELLALEQARLGLRADHRLAVDRGRIVREALAAALVDLQTQGAESELVRRLRSA